ncbi:Alpha/beta hydrolase family protein [Pseudomonas aeruginosa]|nr:Alpha/beta hydrolase family protein [Pseudomonas aeruginosa]
MSLKWNRPAGSLSATLILAHGAGAPMDSPFMERIAELLAAQGIAVARFEFPYMAQRREDGRKRPPNPQAQLLDCWRRVHAQVRETLDGPLALGGKSMGGRMASLLADELGADALVCLGYPFYAAGKPEKPRVAHLAGLRTPTLIVQGERDALGSYTHLRAHETRGNGLCAGADDPPALAGRGGPRPQAAEGLRPDPRAAPGGNGAGGGRLPSRAPGPLTVP